MYGWTNPQKRKFHKTVTAWLSENATLSGPYAFQLQTEAGLLDINVYADVDERGGYSWVAAKFQDVERALALVGDCNHCNGKWNFHPNDGDTPEWFATWVIENLDNVMTHNKVKGQSQ